MSSDDRLSELEHRVEALESLVRKLTAVVEADVEGLRVTDAEVTRQARRLTPGERWPRS